MNRQFCNIMIGGEAGQGLVTIGDLLVKSLVRGGYGLVVTQDYMSRIRGGHNTFTVRAGAGPVQSPREAVDLLVALNEETVELHRHQMSPDGLIVGDASLTLPPGNSLPVPFQDLAEGRFFNITALGVIGSLIGLDEAVIAALLEAAFGKKHPETVAPNKETLARAYEWCAEHDSGSMRLDKGRGGPGRLAMNGNEAIALGAMAAGVKFCSFYPMTPSTSVVLNLAARAKKMGLVVEQAEDEIAAINMAIGASFAGAPSIVSTSGGGFALMSEGVSLAAMVETPVVVVVAQRPGPATGLPTRTEQADLNFVLHAGHGEFGRAIFAPGTVEECFYLTRKAFETSEKFQSPAFVLTDQFLADSFRAVEPFDLDSGPVIDPAGAMAGLQGPYQRYALTADGISPRALPGLSERLVVADSDEHTEDGHLTEDLAVRRLMQEKRLKKAEGLRRETMPPEWSGDSAPDLLLVCWGSTRGAALDAAEQLRADGRRAAVLCFGQVWPLVPEQFLDRLKEAGLAVCVEGNATGQLAGLIRRESGFAFERLVLRSDGLPLTPEYIIRELAS